MASRWLVRCWAALLAGACCASAQSKDPDELATGKILITTRGMGDPLFAESVVLLVNFDRTGAVGLMVNRRTTVPVSHALKELAGAAGRSDPVFIGGPVELDSVFALARASRKPEGGTDVLGEIYLLATKTALSKALAGAVDPSGLRIYLGYCGWGPHQLQNEVTQGGWYIFSRSEGLAFDPEPATLWSRLIKKAEAQIARFGFTLPERAR